MTDLGAADRAQQDQRSRPGGQDDQDHQGEQGERGRRSEESRRSEPGRQASRVSGVFAVRGLAGRSVQAAPKEEGKALRRRVPRGAHAELTFDAGRPDAVTAVEESNLGRIPELTPIRVGRMAATPFAFLRGSAAPVIAYDLARTRDRHRRPDLRRRPRGQLRPVRRRARRPGHRSERLRRDGTRPLGVGPQAPRHLARARGQGSGRGRGHLSQGRPRRGRCLPTHAAAAREAPGAGRVERHRGRGTRLPRRRPRPARHPGAGHGEGAGQHQRTVRGQVDPADGGRQPPLPGRASGAAPGTRRGRPRRSRPRWSTT